jgi:hypothetical protein
MGRWYVPVQSKNKNIATTRVFWEYPLEAVWLGLRSTGWLVRTTFLSAKSSQQTRCSICPSLSIVIGGSSRACQRARPTFEISIVSASLEGVKIGDNNLPLADLAVRADRRGVSHRPACCANSVVIRVVGSETGDRRCPKGI